MKKLAVSSILLALAFLQQTHGQLFVTDSANNDVLQFNQTTGALAAGLNQPRGLEFGPDGELYIANLFHNPPTFMDPGTPGKVFRYDGASATPFATGGNPANFFDIAFPTLAAIPEANTWAMGILLSFFLGLQFARSRRGP